MEVVLDFELLFPQGFYDYHHNDERWFSRTQSHDDIFSKIYGIFHRTGLPLNILSQTPPDGSTWSLRPCPTATVDHVFHRGYDWHGARLTTPRISVSDLDERDIDCVFLALREEMQITINSTCGFHVTVSPSTPGGLDLGTIKRAIRLVWLVEPLLFQLCAPYRADERYCGQITGLSPLAAGLIMRTFSGSKSRYSGDPISIAREALRGLEEVLQRIQEAPDLLSLNILTSHWNTLTPLSVCVGLDGKKGFITFRMHESTLDHTLAKGWTRVCIALVEKSMLEEHEFKNFLDHICQQTQFNTAYVWADLLLGLGVQAPVIKAFAKKRCMLHEFEHIPEPRPWAGQNDEEPELFLPRVSDDIYKIACAVSLPPAPVADLKYYQAPEDSKDGKKNPRKGR